MSDYEKTLDPEAIERIQRALHLTADGVIGPLTRKAIEQYRKDLALGPKLKPDDPKTESGPPGSLDPELVKLLHALPEADTYYEKSLSRSAARHELVCIYSHDPREDDLPKIGYVQFEDSETGEKFLWDIYFFARNGQSGR